MTPGLRLLNKETRQQAVIESLQSEIAELKRDRFEMAEIVTAFKNAAALCRAMGESHPDSIWGEMHEALLRSRPESGPLPYDCPHCGSGDSEIEEFAPGYWRGKCNDCGSTGQVARSREIALFHWNRRAG